MGIFEEIGHSQADRLYDRIKRMKVKARYKKKTYLDYYRLKSIEEIKAITSGRWVKHRGGWQNNLNGWTINEDMLWKCGDGNEYGFSDSEAYERMYTHKGEDGFYYHRSWFEEDQIIELTDKDFML